MTFTFPKDNRARENQGNGCKKSITAQARFCKEPVSLPIAPWDKTDQTEDKTDEQ